MDRLTVPEAAERLGITRDAVYKRIQRNQIPWEKDSDGKVHVYVDQSEAGEYQSTDAVQNQNALIETLREEVEAWREEARLKDTIIAQMNQTIAALTERIPELEPVRESPSDARESPVTASEEEGKGQVPPDVETAKSEPWWRRIFK